MRNKQVGKQPHIIWGGVIYAQAMDFLPDYFASIEAQTDGDFTVLLLDDNMGPDLVARALADYPAIRERAVIVDRYDGLQPYELRVKLLAEAYALDPAAILVIGDCDDSFSADRVEQIRATAQQTMAQTVGEQTAQTASGGPIALYYNQLVSWDEGIIMPDLPAAVTAEDMAPLLEANFIGMSTMAVNLACLDADYIESLSEGRTFVFDWYLASRIIAERGPAQLVPDAFTRYRIHASNQAGLTVLSAEALKKEIAIKIRHYQLMYDTINCVCASADTQEKIQSLRQTYRDLAEGYERLEEDEAAQAADLQQAAADSGRLKYWWDIIHLL